MRHVRIAAAFALTLGLIGCMATPRPARTEITPGESEIISERDERRPTESIMRIRATVPQEAPVRIRIIVPREE